MGDKATCPVCDSHTGAIYYAFENLSPCPVCGTSFETIQVFKDIKNKKEQYKKAKLEKGVIEEIISLRKELALSKEREKKAIKELDFIKEKFEELWEELNLFSDVMDK